jgi:hypothetical protein
LDFEFLLVLNHDDVIWDYPKKEDMGKRMMILKRPVLGRMKGVVSTL